MTQQDKTHCQFLSFPGLSGSIAALGFGNPQGQKILALHGWLDNAASFGPLSDYLKDHYIVALDFPGHGFSERRPDGGIYHLTDYVCDIAQVIESLNWQKFVLMGHSLGAGVAILYAAVFHELVEKLVLIDGIGPISARADTACERMRKSIEAHMIHSKNPDRAPKIYPDWDKLVSARMLASPLSAGSAALLLERGTSETAGGVVVNADPRLKHPSAIYLAEEVVLHFIVQVSCPSLLILAEQGMVINREMTAGRINAFEKLRVEYLSGQHHLHMDTPELVADVINPFLQATED